MAQPSFPNDIKWRLERVEADLRELHRKRDRRAPDLGHLHNVNGWGAADGHTPLYDSTIGRYKVALAPPFLVFDTPDAILVSSSNQTPMGGTGKLILVEARLTTTGSSTTTALLKHTTANGATTTTVATFSFTSGNHTPTTTPTVAFSFVRSDYFWVDITAAGTSAAGLVINGWGTAA